MSTPADIATAAQLLVARLRSTCVDPADSLRLLADLAIYAPDGGFGTDTLGAALAGITSATGDLCRRAAVVALARASALYQPASQDDAAAVRSRVVAQLDNEITRAGDQGEDASYKALKDLRSAVVRDLTARGADLAPIKTFSFNASLPALVLANRIYRDAGRADELVTQADPVHPAFMPLLFKALAA